MPVMCPSMKRSSPTSRNVSYTASENRQGLEVALYCIKCLSVLSLVASMASSHKLEGWNPETLRASLMAGVSLALVSCSSLLALSPFSVYRRSSLQSSASTASSTLSFFLS